MRSVSFHAASRETCVVGSSGRWSVVKRQLSNRSCGIPSKAGAPCWKRQTGSAPTNWQLVSAPDSAEPLRQAAEDYFSGVTQWPKGGQDAVKTALGRTSGADLEANEKALRLLCVRAEILADRPSPPEDQPLRREYQVQRLMQSMGQGITVDASQMDTLTMEWVQAGPIDEARYTQLLERFKACRPH